MKSSKRIVSLLVALLLIATVLAGCSGGSAPASGSPAPTASSGAAPSAAASVAPTASGAGQVEKVYLLAWASEAAGKSVVDGFNQTYAGKYEMVYTKVADATTMTLNTALASGEQIDVMTQSSAVDQHTRAINGVYMPLNDFLKADNIDYAQFWGPSIEATQNYDGKYYGIPYCKNVLVTFINENMFDKAGVPYPKDDWTWEDFRDTAKKFVSGEGANKVYGVMMDYIGEDYAWDYLAREKDGAFYNYNKDYTATTYDQPEMKESLQFFYDMVMTDKSMMPLDEYKTLKLDNDTNGMNGLYSGRYAMWLAPVYSAGYMKPNIGPIPDGTRIGMANLPRRSDSDGPETIVYTSTASIPANVKDPQAAWTALKFLTIDRPDLWAGAKTMHPGFAFTDKDALHKFNELILGKDSGIPGLDYDMAVSLMDKSRKEISKDNPILQGQTKIKDLQTAELTLLFNGQETVDQCLANLKSKGDAFIQEDIAAGLKG